MESSFYCPCLSRQNAMWLLNLSTFKIYAIKINGIWKGVMEHRGKFRIKFLKVIRKNSYIKIMQKYWYTEILSNNFNNLYAGILCRRNHYHCHISYMFCKMRYLLIVSTGYHIHQPSTRCSLRYCRNRHLRNWYHSDISPCTIYSHHFYCKYHSLYPLCAFPCGNVCYYT